jgi:hypothetical protein
VGKQLDDLRASRISTEKMLQQVGQDSRQHLRRSRWMLHRVAGCCPAGCRLERPNQVGSRACTHMLPADPAHRTLAAVRPGSPQVVRQRDTLRQLLQSSGTDLDHARKAYLQAPGPAGGTPGGATPSPAGLATPGQGVQDGAPGSGAASGPDYRGMYADLEQQYKEYKQEVARTHDMLGKDVSRVALAGLGGLGAALGAKLIQAASRRGPVRWSALGWRARGQWLHHTVRLSLPPCSPP